jgi:hypothetical protein
MGAVASKRIATVNMRVPGYSRAAIATVRLVGVNYDVLRLVHLSDFFLSPLIFFPWEI